MAGMILIWTSLINVQMVPVHCISTSHRLKIDFRDEKIFLSETMKHYLVDLYQIGSNYASGVKTALAGGHMFYISPRAFIFGTRP